jgi:hypothetical protein
MATEKKKPAAKKAPAKKAAAKKAAAKKAPAKKAAAPAKKAPTTSTATKATGSYSRHMYTAVEPGSGIAEPAEKTAAKREITQSPSGLAPMTGTVTPEGKITISTTPTPKAAPAKKKSFFARLFRR